MATTPQDLLFVVNEIERAIPRALKFVMSEEALPSAADTCAALAARVFVLDRMVRYDEIRDVEKQVRPPLSHQTTLTPHHPSLQRNYHASHQPIIKHPSSHHPRISSTNHQPIINHASTICQSLTNYCAIGLLLMRPNDTLSTHPINTPLTHPIDTLLIHYYQGNGRMYRPRYQFAPRCMLASTCSKYLGHTGTSSQTIIPDLTIVHPHILPPPPLLV